MIKESTIVYNNTYILIKRVTNGIIGALNYYILNSLEAEKYFYNVSTEKTGASCSHKSYFCL